MSWTSLLGKLCWDGRYKVFVLHLFCYLGPML